MDIELVNPVKWIGLIIDYNSDIYESVWSRL